MLEGTAEQIIDSTPMLGAAATQDTVRLVRHGVRKLIDAVAAPTRGPLAGLMSAWSLNVRVPSQTAGGARRGMHP